MKTLLLRLVGGFVIFLAGNAQAGVHYVDLNSTNATPPFTDWTTAATNIQDAIDASTNGDTVLVTNGIYASSGKSEDGLITNRVALDKAIRVQSVNGPWLTTIKGAGATNGPAAVRCAWLTNNAVLVGFTVTGGATLSTGNMLNQESGGAVWCASANCFVDNCAIVSNTAHYDGSGCYQGTLQNCLISSNSGARNAAYDTTLSSCTVVGNSNFGVSGVAMTNCIVYYNSVMNYQNVSGAAYCCTTPAISGTGNFTNAPELLPDGVHLSSGSPCIGAGTNLVVGTDIFGMAWANPPSIGCAEFDPLPTINQPSVTLIGSPVGFEIGNVILGGQQPLSFAWLENGVPLLNNGHFNSTQATNLVVIGVNLADAGSYQLVVSNVFGSVTSAAVQLAVHAVDAAGVNPQPPFSTWATAATSIQDAIEAASAGDIVLVTNGVYDTGGEIMAGGLTNRIALDKALMVASVDGFAHTVIEGAWDPVSTNGPAAVRCAWLTNGAVLSGFTLQNGATWNTGDDLALQSGGGAWCASTNALVSNCLLSNNFASYGGGAVSFGTLNNSLVVFNVASYGGGAYNTTLNNCTVENNYITVALSDRGGGTYGGFIQNCIVINNFDGYPELFGVDNYATIAGAQLEYAYSCTFNSFGQIPPGTGNTNTDPQFLDWYHISINSPCRGAGSALYASGTDLDNELWNNPPSIGCDEVVPANRTGLLSVSTQSSESNVLVSGPSVAHVDSFQGAIVGQATYLSWNFGDGPTITNADYLTLHYWTNAGDYTVVFTAYNLDNPAGVSATQVIHVMPVNAPQLQSPSIVSNRLQFQFTMQAGANYTVQYATNLSPPVIWSPLQSIYHSSGGVIQIQDPTATNATRFYRVLAQ